MNKNMRKEYVYSTSGDTMVTEDGFNYKSTVRVDKTDNTAVIWETDEPLGITRADFSKVVTVEDFYETLKKINVMGIYPDGFFEDIFKIKTLDEIEKVSVAVSLEKDLCPEYHEIFEEEFEQGGVSYEFVAGAFVCPEDAVAAMTDALTEYAETAGFADYYNRELKDKSEEEIRALYAEVFER